MPSGAESPTLLRDGVVVEPVDRFLAHLKAVERSPNAVKAHAHDLRDLIAFLDVRGLDWFALRLEDLGRFVEWLRVPAAARSDAVALLPWVDGHVSVATVNRKLSAVASFYEFHSRHGVELADLLARRPGRRGGSWQPFLAHLGQRPERHRTISLRAERRAATALPAGEMDAVVAACDRLRDRFLLFVLRGCGLRIGAAWGCGMRTSTRAVSSSPSDLARTNRRWAAASAVGAGPAGPGVAVRPGHRGCRRARGQDRSGDPSSFNGGLSAVEHSRRTGRSGPGRSIPRMGVAWRSG